MWSASRRLHPNAAVSSPQPPSSLSPRPSWSKIRSERATPCSCASSRCWVTAWGVEEVSGTSCGSRPKRLEKHWEATARRRWHRERERDFWLRRRRRRRWRWKKKSHLPGNYSLNQVGSKQSYIKLSTLLLWLIKLVWRYRVMVNMMFLFNWLLIWKQKQKTMTKWFARKSVEGDTTDMWLMWVRSCFVWVCF